MCAENLFNVVQGGTNLHKYCYMLKSICLDNIHEMEPNTAQNNSWMLSATKVESVCESALTNNIACNETKQ